MNLRALLVLDFACRAWAETCSSVIANAGMNPVTLAKSARGLFAVNVRDIQYYFDPTFPEDNDLPTVNLDLASSTLLLASAPLGGDFEAPGLRMMDLVMANDDNFMLQGLSRLEKIAVGVGILEMLQKVSSGMYKRVVMKPPTPDICSCVTDEQANGMLEHLEELSKEIRSDYRGFRFKNAPKQKALPILQDPDSWAVWKAHLLSSIPDDYTLWHFAVYLYCKINNTNM